MIRLDRSEHGYRTFVGKLTRRQLLRRLDLIAERRAQLRRTVAEGEKSTGGKDPRGREQKR